ncbi:hypothetical protein Sjap_002409 [Stephania japonica]|uniref:Uncharacterized protein n=1 Tax=Stephania japonica TaxID=461633 RepID=A0AAP0PUI2_9MAGN
MSTRPTSSDFRRNFTPPGFNDRQQVAYGGNGGNTSIGINPSFDATYLQRRNFNAPEALIRRHQPLRCSFTYEAAVRSTNSSSMNGSSRQGNNATPRFPLHQARPANQSFHLRNNYRPPREVPPTNQNNYLIRYEIPPAQQDSDARRNEVPPHLRNVRRHHQNLPAQPVTMCIGIANFVVTLQDVHIKDVCIFYMLQGVDIELTPQDYQAIRAHAAENGRRSSSRNEKRMD